MSDVIEFITLIYNPGSLQMPDQIVQMGHRKPISSPEPYHITLL